MAWDWENPPTFVEGQEVKADIGGVWVKARVRGVATTNLIPLIILERTDGEFDPAVYPFSHFCLPGSLLEVVE